MSFLYSIAAHAVGLQPFSLAYHALSGTILVGLESGYIDHWTTQPLETPPRWSVRGRLESAQAELGEIKPILDSLDGKLRNEMKREMQLKASIKDLEAKRT